MINEIEWSFASSSSSGSGGGIGVGGTGGGGTVSSGTGVMIGVICMALHIGTTCIRISSDSSAAMIRFISSKIMSSMALMGSTGGFLISGMSSSPKHSSSGTGGGAQMGPAILSLLRQKSLKSSQAVVNLHKKRLLIKRTVWTNPLKGF